MDLARKVFNEIPERDVVAWTALIIEHVHNGEPQKGLRCLRHMHCEDAPMPNARTWEGGFLACGSLGAVKRATKTRNSLIGEFKKYANESLRFNPRCRHC
ncbi:hypothetical protein JHK82_014522 [Glycine max]|nr:hypothetical protein JHK82_014522 [Glycine max]